MKSGLVLAWPHPQSPPRFYLAAMEKNWEKGWDQKLHHGPEMVDSVYKQSPPFLVRDVALIPGFLPIFLQAAR